MSSVAQATPYSPPVVRALITAQLATVGVAGLTGRPTVVSEAAR
ncbi:hypothetical protein [Micromonospora sp. NPDC005189]